MLAKSSLTKSLFSSSLRLAVEAGDCLTRDTAVIDDALREGALTVRDSISWPRLHVNGGQVVGEKKAGAMAGQEDNPKSDASRAEAHAPSVEYETAGALTDVESVVYAPGTVLKTPCLAVKPPRQSVAFVSPIGFAPMGGSAANKRPARGICPPSRHGFELLPTRLKNGPIVSSRSKAMRGITAARPEQTYSSLQVQIINRALRDAALAPSANDALDCCAEALLHLAEIARAEVTHG